MRLLLDENTARRTFVRLLQEKGYDVEIVTKALAPAARDEAIVAYAVRVNRVVVTQDTADCISLYIKLTSHPGLILIYPTSGSQPVTKLAVAIDNVALIYTDLNNMVLALHEFFW